MMVAVPTVRVTMEAMKPNEILVNMGFKTIYDDFKP
jgi:hypothetical protein